MPPTTEELAKVAEWLRLHAIEHTQPKPCPDRFALSNVGDWLRQEISRKDNAEKGEDDQYALPG